VGISLSVQCLCLFINLAPILDDIFSCVIIKKVDAAAPVSAVLINSLTGGERRTLKRLPGGKPYVFHFDGLEPERHYALRFEGVENAASR